MTTLLPYGRTATLLEAADSAEALRLDRAVRAAGLDGVVESVPAARTVLVIFADERSRATAQERLGQLAPTEKDAWQPQLVEVPTRYDGPDLDEVARLTGMSPEDVVARHTEMTYTVGFIGFAPGFAYLTGVAEELRVPRRASPRTAVPPGSVALAGELTAVYPRSSPGGWQLIGSTDLQMWDIERAAPGLLRPGDQVRFVEVRS